jgi:hypothetical protein
MAALYPTGRPTSYTTRWDTILQVVPYILGLAHPSGNPTGILAGWIWAHAFCPFGEPALRENLLSAAPWWC